MAERMHIGKVAALALAVLALLCSTALAGDEYTERYRNARFGYTIDVPIDLFTPQGESANGDGQTYLGYGGETMLLVWASHLVDNPTLEEAALSWTQGRDVTYKRLKGDWFVMSGYGEGKIFYQKTIIRNGVGYNFILSYPPNERHIYDPVCGQLVKSFKAPR